jgi:hypothetical protein
MLQPVTFGWNRTVGALLRNEILQAGELVADLRNLATNLGQDRNNKIRRLNLQQMKFLLSGFIAPEAICRDWLSFSGIGFHSMDARSLWRPR